MFPLRTMQTQINGSKNLHVVVRMQRTIEVKIYTLSRPRMNFVPRLCERNVHVNNLASRKFGGILSEKLAGSEFK